MQASFREHELPSNIKESLDYRKEEQESPVTCLEVSLGTRHSASFCPSLAFTGGRGVGFRRAEAAASCHCHFITHLLIVANEDFTAPPALIVSCGNVLMEGERKASLRIPSRGPCTCLASSFGSCKPESVSYNHLVMRQGGVVGLGMHRLPAKPCFSHVLAKPSA